MSVLSGTVLTVLLCALAACENRDLPYFLKTCHRSDPELNVCIHESIELLRPRLAKGIPELYIPPIEPLDVPEIKVNGDSGPIYVHSIYKNILLYGVSQFALKEVKFDMKRDKFMLKFWFPHIMLRADYTINGKIMMMPLYGHGGCNANFTDVDIASYIQGERFKKNGDVYMRIKDITIKYKTGKSQIQLDNLFNGDKTLGASMNSFLNENWKIVSSEIHPVIQDAMAQMMRRSSEHLFENFTLDKLLPE